MANSNEDKEGGMKPPPDFNGGILTRVMDLDFQVSGFVDRQLMLKAAQRKQDERLKALENDAGEVDITLEALLGAVHTLQEENAGLKARLERLETLYGQLAYHYLPGGELPEERTGLIGRMCNTLRNMGRD